MLSTDDAAFGGWDRISTEYIYTAKKQPDGKARLQIYLPARTGLCLKKV
ncbi:MAG: alpha amylase C-terminal domain-containing protein [Clostridia bacterium]|nr:alpha amylase C-terminal domain-containing protein [Clostridia bacterium]